MAVSDCSVTERRRWRPPYQTGKTVHLHAKHYKHNEDRTHGAGCVRQWFRTAEPPGERRYENWNTHTHESPVFSHITLSWQKIFLPTIEAACNALLSHYNFQYKIKEKTVTSDQFFLNSRILLRFCRQVTKAHATCCRLISTYQLSACPLVSMIKLLKRRIIRYITSRVFFCKRFFFLGVCFFKTVSTQLNLFVGNILSKRTLKHRPSAQNTFIDVTKR